VPLSNTEAIEQAKRLKGFHESERAQLDILRRYWKGRQGLAAVFPGGTPSEVKRMAQMARVNVIGIVVDSLAHSTFVDGYRSRSETDENVSVWSSWQANRMDARQSGIHRAAFAYGTAYAVVTPSRKRGGDAVIRGVSPRRLTAIYGDDPDWPMWALERLDGGLWRLFDEEASYFVSETIDNRRPDRERSWEFVERREHREFGVTPVVRYQDEDDLDADDDIESADGRAGEDDYPNRGQVSPLMPLQDQIDLTTFGLLVAQHYSAFRQRYAIGWVAPEERELVERMLDGKDEDEDPEKTARAIGAARLLARQQAGSGTLWTFDESPEDLKLGEFSQTDLGGYIKSRETTIKYAATLSQTPVHELIGEMINLSAEALAAAEAGRDRKVGAAHTMLGEAHEQTMWLAGKVKGQTVPDDAEVRWRDTSARAFSATVDALGKMVTMLGIPPQELWERVPGATRQDIERWKTAAEDGDSFRFLSDLLERQQSPA
jgi:hypothetical protein